jgi:hypothetical protein
MEKLQVAVTVIDAIRAGCHQALATALQKTPSAPTSLILDPVTEELQLADDIASHLQAQLRRGDDVGSALRTKLPPSSSQNPSIRFLQQHPVTEKLMASAEKTLRDFKAQKVASADAIAAYTRAEEAILKSSFTVKKLVLERTLFDACSGKAMSRMIGLSTLGSLDISGAKLGANVAGHMAASLSEHQSSSVLAARRADSSSSSLQMFVANNMEGNNVGSTLGAMVRSCPNLQHLNVKDSKLRDEELVAGLTDHPSLKVTEHHRLWPSSFNSCTRMGIAEDDPWSCL